MKATLALFLLFSTTYAAYADTCAVKVPAGKSLSQVSFSKDCQTAYILPSTEIKNENLGLGAFFTADSRICERLELVKNSYESSKEEIKELFTILEKIKKDLDAATTDEARALINNKIKYLTKAIEDQTLDLEKMFDSFDKTQALRAQFTLEFKMHDQVIAFEKANQGAVSGNGKIYPTKFTASSKLIILSLTPTDLLAKKNSFNVQMVNASSYSPTANDVGKYGKNALLYNVDIETFANALVNLSATSYCSAITKLKETTIPTSHSYEEIFRTALEIKLNY